MGSDATDAYEFPHRPGQRIGNYEIVGPLGRGGMGIVYRARDLRLPRDVALKCPKPGSAADTSFMKRFTREVRAASQLSSPYVVPVFEVFEAEGSPWLAMELVEGRTLHELLREQARLPLPRVLKYAERVTRALREAHEKGILHRDINPNNLMIGPRDQARLMDFGLARLDEVVDPSSVAATGSMPLTGQHAVGTPGYMAPEQALGREVDARSDIFSLGAVIHEMCTGERAFTNIDEVLHKQLPDLTCVDQEAPEELVRLVRRATAKDPGQRYPSAGELLADLKSLRRSVDFKDYALSHPEIETPRTGTRSRGPRAALAAVTLLILVVATWYVATRIFPPDPTVSSQPDYRLVPLATWPTEERDVRISPDLQWVSFVSNRDGRKTVWLQRMEGGQTRSSTAEDHRVSSHLWSPDASELAYLRQEGESILLEIVPAPLGGRSRLSVALGEGDRSAPTRLIRWIGTGIYIEVLDGLWRFDLGSTSFEPVFSRLPGLETFNGIDVHPDGERIVLSGYADGQENLWVADIDGSGLRQITHDAYRARRPLWVGSKNSVHFLSNRTGQIGLWNVALDGGAAVQIPLNRTVKDLTDVSADGGAVAIQVTEERADLWALDPATLEHRPLIDDALAEMLPFASRQGSVFAFQRIDPGLGLAFLDSQIVVGRWTGGALTDLVPEVEVGCIPKLSNDGRWLSYLRPSKGQTQSVELWLQDLTTHRATRISDRFQVTGWYDAPLPAEVWSRNLVWAHQTDGLFLTELAEDTGAPQIVRVTPGDAGPQPEVLVSRDDPDERMLHISLSPDDQKIAYVVDYWGEAPSAPPLELRVLEIGSGRDRLLSTPDPDERIRVLGWTHGGDQLVTLRETGNPDLTNRVGVVTYDHEGRTQMRGTIERAFGATARLIGEDDAVYITGVEGNSHNLFAFSLMTGEYRALTRNRLPGVTFSGLTRTADGALIHTRQVENYDVWILLANQPKEGG